MSKILTGKISDSSMTYQACTFLRHKILTVMRSVFVALASCNACRWSMQWIIMLWYCTCIMTMSLVSILELSSVVSVWVIIWRDHNPIWELPSCQCLLCLLAINYRVKLHENLQTTTMNISTLIIYTQYCQFWYLF